jgi:hypothetical protein
VKIKENIKKHKLTERIILNKEIYLSLNLSYEEGDVNLEHNNTKICASIVSLLSDYLGLGYDYNHGDLKIRCTQTIYRLLKCSKALVQTNIEHVENEGYFIGYMLGIKYYTNSNAYPMRDGSIIELYNKEELIGEIKWQWIQ